MPTNAIERKVPIDVYVDACSDDIYASLASNVVDPRKWPLRDVMINGRKSPYSRMFVCCVDTSTFEEKAVLSMKWSQHLDLMENGANAQTVSAAVMNLFLKRKIRYSYFVAPYYFVAVQRDWLITGTTLDYQVLNYTKQVNRRHMCAFYFGVDASQGVFQAASKLVHHESGDIDIRAQLASEKITTAQLDKIRIKHHSEHDARAHIAVGITNSARNYAPYLREVVPQRAKDGTLLADRSAKLVEVDDSLVKECARANTQLNKYAVKAKQALLKQTENKKRSSSAAEIGALSETPKRATTEPNAFVQVIEDTSSIDFERIALSVWGPIVCEEAGVCMPPTTTTPPVRVALSPLAHAKSLQTPIEATLNSWERSFVTPAMVGLNEIRNATKNGRFASQDADDLLVRAMCEFE